MTVLRNGFGCFVDDEDKMKFIGLEMCICCVVLYGDFCGRVYVAGTCVIIIIQQLWTTESVN
jgi:hypothetical protein